MTSKLSATRNTVTFSQTVSLRTLARALAMARVDMVELAQLVEEERNQLPIEPGQLFEIHKMTLLREVDQLPEHHKRAWIRHNWGIRRNPQLAALLTLPLTRVAQMTTRQVQRELHFTAEMSRRLTERIHRWRQRTKQPPATEQSEGREDHD